MVTMKGCTWSVTIGCGIQAITGWYLTNPKCAKKAFPTLLYHLPLKTYSRAYRQNYWGHIVLFIPMVDVNITRSCWLVYVHDSMYCPAATFIKCSAGVFHYVSYNICLSLDFLIINILIPKKSPLKSLRFHQNWWFVHVDLQPLCFPLEKSLAFSTDKE